MGTIIDLDIFFHGVYEALLVYSTTCAALPIKPHISHCCYDLTADIYFFKENGE